MLVTRCCHKPAIQLFFNLQHLGDPADKSREFDTSVSPTHSSAGTCLQHSGLHKATAGVGSEQSSSRTFNYWGLVGSILAVLCVNATPRPFPQATVGIGLAQGQRLLNIFSRNRLSVSRSCSISLRRRWSQSYPNGPPPSTKHTQKGLCQHCARSA